MFYWYKAKTARGRAQKFVLELRKLCLTADGGKIFTLAYKNNLNNNICIVKKPWYVNYFYLRGLLKSPTRYNVSFLKILILNSKSYFYFGQY